jgi:mRNA-degrading endonuclease RelE of RelBE toxin-antitoxin system
MRRLESLNTYSVEVSPTAWKQLAHLPLETYQRIRQSLDGTAARLRTPTPLPLPRKVAPPIITRSIELEGYIALYDVDTERRRLMLREVVRQTPKGP